MQRKKQLLRVLILSSYETRKCTGKEWLRIAGTSATSLANLKANRPLRADNLVPICNNLGIECGGTLLHQKLDCMSQLIDLAEEGVRLPKSVLKRCRTKDTDTISLDYLWEFLYAKR